MARMKLQLFLAVAAISLCTACGGSSGPKTAEVKGSVFYNGQPLTQGSVQFVAERGRDASGRISTDGAFTASMPEGKGVVVGPCQIAIIAVKDGKPVPGERMIPPIWLIPQNFGDPSLSGLHGEVKEGNNQFKIELFKNGRGAVTRVE